MSLDQTKIYVIISFAAEIGIYGPVAQLGERSVRIREVEGSNPFGSTNEKTTTNVVVFSLGSAPHSGAPPSGN